MAAHIDSVMQNLADGGTPVELLMIGCTPNEAHECANELRNNGQAAHIACAGNDGELAQLVETHPCDMVVIKTGVTNISLDNAIDLVRKHNPSSAILLLAEHPSQQLAYASANDLRDVIRNQDIAHLAFAIRREYQNLLMRQELSRMHHRLLESENRFDELMGQSRDAVAYVHEGMHIHANAVYQQMFGITDPDEIEGLPLMDLIAPDARGAFKKTLRNLEKEQNFSAEIQCQSNDGRSFAALMEFSPAEIDDEPCVQIVIRDQSLQHELEARIDELTNRDPQTGLFNRQAFMERLEGAIASGKMANGAGLVQIKVRNFDEIRDRNGIEKSDRLLHTLAQNLQQHAQGAHTLARFGDHDFVILCEQSDDLTALANQCLADLSGQDFAAETGVADAPEFSVGLTLNPNQTVSAHELVSRTCRITKQAAAGPANQLLSYVEKAPEQAREELDPAVIALIDHALENDGFVLTYQPIVSLQGDTRENYSVLLRLLDKNGEEKLPETFWPHAERAERLADIDRWVVRSSIRELVKHRREGKKINFFVNLSDKGIADDSMLLWICDCLREFKAKGAWLTFQFSEPELHGQLQPAKKLIDGLKKINCRVAISHFQDNRDSQTLIKHLPVDVIKLSPEFLTNLAAEPDRQDRLADVNSKLQRLGHKTIASGVEDANSLAILWNVGVNYIQGFFLQAPSTTIDFDAP